MPALIFSGVSFWVLHFRIKKCLFGTKMSIGDVRFFTFQHKVFLTPREDAGIARPNSVARILLSTKRDRLNGIWLRKQPN